MHKGKPKQHGNAGIARLDCLVQLGRKCPKSLNKQINKCIYIYIYIYIFLCITLYIYIYIHTHIYIYIKCITLYIYIHRTPYKPPNKAEGIGAEVQAKNCGRSEGDTF